MNANNASTVIPTRRRGRDNSHTIGRRISANNATGQQSTNRIHHPTKTSRACMMRPFLHASREGYNSPHPDPLPAGEGTFCESGWGGIRTPGGLSPTAVFKTAALDHSATHPKRLLLRPGYRSTASLAVAPAFCTWRSSLVSLSQTAGVASRQLCRSSDKDAIVAHAKLRAKAAVLAAGWLLRRIGVLWCDLACPGRCNRLYTNYLWR
jgi:hypothetical protein